LNPNDIDETYLEKLSSAAPGLYLDEYISPRLDEDSLP
jgi:hypothetical protein